VCSAVAHTAPLLKTRPSVFIVVLNWNGLSDTLECLEAVGRLDYPNRHVVVVDNGSTDGSADTIAARYPSATLIRHRENLGYTGGVNAGIEHAIQHGADYVWLLNNDAVVTPRSLTQLLTFAERHPRMGLLSPIIRYYDKPHDIQFAGTLVEEPPARVPHIQCLEAGALLTGDIVLVGTALLIRSAVVTGIGLLDDRYFAYCEDWDYSLRARAAGFEVAVLPSAIVFHKSAGSLGHDSPLKEYLMVRNRYLVWRSHLTGWQRRAYTSRYLAWALERVHSARGSGSEVVAGAALDGAWDAFHGRFGPRPAGSTMPSALKRALLTLLSWHPLFWVMLLRGRFAAIIARSLRRGVGQSTPRDDR
jgi:GT2 family glycosyltransferase